MIRRTGHSSSADAIPRADALLRLLAGAVGEADDRERRHAELEVRLDLDAAGVEADERVRDGAGEHTSKLGANVCRVCAGSVPKVELLGPRDEHVFEVLARAAARAPVHVPAVTLLQPQARRSRISG